MALQTELLKKSLTHAFDDFIAVFSSFSESEINRQPFHGSWTPAQVATHIILATDGLPDSSTRPLDREVDFQLASIRPWWEDVNQKFHSPEQLWPDHNPRTKNMVISDLRRVRDKDLTIVEREDLSLICLDMELPTVGFLTRYEWLWFIEMHLRRHLYQLQKMGTSYGLTASKHHQL